jgi:hypothetical protein
VWAPGSALAFYVPQGNAFAATELTRGPWDPDSQHAGPPCALLGRVVERAGGLAEARLARITFEILKPLPIAPLTPAAAVVRPGRRVEMIEGSLSHDGVEVLRARAWRIRTGAVALPDEDLAEQPPPGPQEGREGNYFDVDWSTGYQTAMELRLVSGSYTEPGPARAWMRMRVPLIEGEEPSALDRLLVVADSGNGISSPLELERYLFTNVDVSVAVRRPPSGEWVCIDAVTYAEPDGVGLSDSALYDERGLIGRATQSLLVAERQGS